MTYIAPKSYKNQGALILLQPTWPQKWNKKSIKCKYKHMVHQCFIKISSRNIHS